MAAGDSSRLPRVPNRAPISASSRAASASRSSSAAIARASSRRRLAAASPAVRTRRSMRSSISGRLRVRGRRPGARWTQVLEVRSGAGAEVESADEGHVRRYGSGPPARKQHDTGKFDPSSPRADQAESAIGGRSRFEGGTIRHQRPGKVPRHDAPQIPAHNGFGRVFEVAGVEAGSELAESPGLDRPRHGMADRRM